jgi:iron complex transport system substrate-binding protein
VRRLALALLVLGCQKSEPPGGPTRTFQDDRGRPVAIPQPLRRIVSLAPSTTELLFEAGAGDQVAGVTTYCDYPPAARPKPKIGNVVVDLEALHQLRPDLVVTSWTLGRRVGEELEGKGYAVYALDPSSFEEIAGALVRLGEMTGHAAQGSEAARALLGRVRGVRERPGPTFYFEYSADPLGTTGPETYLGRALKQAGGKNVIEGGWKLIEWEEVLSKNPEVILIAHDQREGLDRRAGWKRLRAVQNGRVHFVAKDHYVYPTPRLAEGLREAAELFHGKDP